LTNVPGCGIIIIERKKERVQKIMKQFIFSLILVIAFVMAVGCAGGIEHNYTRPDCEVIAVGRGVVTVEDKGGNVWEFEGSGYCIGDKVDLKMHTNLTHNTCADDYIVDVQ
jgi:hypothetical protein